MGPGFVYVIEAAVCAVVEFLSKSRSSCCMVQLSMKHACRITGKDDPDLVAGEGRMTCSFTEIVRNFSSSGGSQESSKVIHVMHT